MKEIARLVDDNRLVTLTGAGGVGKTRLAVHVATDLAGEFGDGVWYVDLAPITDPEVVPVTVARALGLPDQPGRSTMDTLLRFIARPAACWWCWTTASTCWMRAPRCRLLCWVPARG